MSPSEEARKVRLLIADAKKELAKDRFEEAAGLVGEALDLRPESRQAQELKKEIEEDRIDFERKDRRKQLVAHQQEGAKLLEKGEVDKALQSFRSAQQLDPDDSRTFRLVEQAYKLRADQETKERMEAFRKGEPGTEGSASVEPSGQREPLGPDATAAEREGNFSGEYTVQPDDVLQVTVFEEPDLTTRARVSRTGHIIFPMLGQVSVAGMTVSQVQMKLTELLGESYLVHPQIQVFVDKPSNVFVTGEVHRPGSYPVSTEKSTTVMEVISLAGGFTEDADLNGTRIIRMRNGKKDTIRVRVTDVIRKGDKSKDEMVQPDDIIFVPESFF